MVAVKFGDWQARTAELRHQFDAALPFPHVVIPNFFADDTATALEADFPLRPDSSWHHYDNPIEQKYALRDFTGLPVIQNVFDCLQSPEFVQLMRSVTGIPGLATDPCLHGAGLHAYPRGGKLDIHLDYSLHPVTGMERRVNLIVYMNREWTYAGGHLQLFNEKLEPLQSLAPAFNTAVLFRTSDESYHGLPEPIDCAPDVFRKSVAVYYVSEPRAGVTHRLKAEFFPKPGQSVEPRLRRLYDIRPHRLITPEDLADWPTWRSDGCGFW